MQSIAPVTTDQLLAPGQQPKAKFEIYNNKSWINLNNLHEGDGLVGWWAFDEGAGMTAYDHSKNGNHGTLTNMTEEDWVDGKVGKALDFDGDNDFIDLGSTIFNGTIFTLSFWIGDYVEDPYDFLFGAVGNKNFLLNYSGNIAFRESDGTYHTFIANSNIESGTYHVVFVSDGTDISLYIDGVYKTKITPTSTAFAMSRINAGYSTSQYLVQCTLDEIYLYNRALTEGEIKALADLKGKNYLEDWSISLGGASMTPNPIGGTWNVTLSNENGIFHPKHPDSAYKDYLVTGRKARLSIGGKYGGTDYYWQRIIGHMDEPSFDITGAKINIRGGDYMKFLQDTEFRSSASPGHNYWGSSETFDSIASDGTSGAEKYTEADAMDILLEEDDVVGWNTEGCAFVSLAEEGGGSSYVGKITTNASGDADITNPNIFIPTIGKEYSFQFRYKLISGEWANVLIFQGSKELSRLLRIEETDWTVQTVYFTAQTTDPIQIQFYFVDVGGVSEFWVDQFSIKEFTSYWERYYELPAACKGVHRVILDGEDVWHGGDKGWHYTENAEPGPDPPAHPARIAWFDINKEVAAGSSNLVIYYFTTTAMEDVVADLLVTAGLYADRATAKANMDYTDPAVDIDEVWFKTGSPVLRAIKMICERLDYRFHFAYNGKPTFQPKPAGATVFTFTDQKHIASPQRYEDRNEIWNRIVIEGKAQQDETFYQEESLSSELRGEASDATSITAYGERTLMIKNHLFQNQAPLDAMCASLLAQYKDPKWYTDFDTPYNPVPLELRDKTSWKERLSPVLDITASGFIRDIKLSKFDSTYKCECV